VSRYLIQSAVTWEFLHCDPRTGDVCFTPSLLAALNYGVIEDADQVAQIVEDHCDRGSTLVVDLDAERD